MRKDQVLVNRFFGGYNQRFGTSYKIVERPEDTERQQEAVEAVARDGEGRTLAIEHTLIQPFIGEKDDAQRLLAAIAPLQADSTLRVPGKSIDVSVPVWAIPKGPEWKAVGAKVIDWFRETRLSLPEGESARAVPGLGFGLTLRVTKDGSPYPEGRIYVSRSDMPRDFESVVRKAMKDKLPKLGATLADKRILLLEKDNLPHGYTEIGKIIESLKGEFPDLSKVDEVWVVNTVAWASEGCLFFIRVWPGGVKAKFRVDRGH